MDGVVELGAVVLGTVVVGVGVAGATVPGWAPPAGVVVVGVVAAGVVAAGVLAAGALLVGAGVAGEVAVPFTRADAGGIVSPSFLSVVVWPVAPAAAAHVGEPAASVVRAHASATHERA